MVPDAFPYLMEKHIQVHGNVHVVQFVRYKREIRLSESTHKKIILDLVGGFSYRSLNVNSVANALLLKLSAAVLMHSLLH